MDNFSRLCVYNYFINFETFSAETKFRGADDGCVFRFGDRVNLNFVAPADFYKQIVENYTLRCEHKNQALARQLGLAREFLNDKIGAAKLLRRIAEASLGIDGVLHNSVNRLLHYYTSGGTEEDAGLHPAVAEQLRWLDENRFGSNRCDLPDDSLAAAAWLDAQLDADAGQRIDAALHPLLYAALKSNTLTAVRNLADILGNGHPGSWYHKFTACAFLAGLKRARLFGDLSRFYESVNKWKLDDELDYSALYGKMCGLGRRVFTEYKRECVHLLFRIMTNQQYPDDSSHHSYEFISKFARVVRDTYVDNSELIVTSYYGAKSDKEKNRIFALLCVFDSKQLMMYCRFIAMGFLENQ